MANPAPVDVSSFTPAQMTAFNNANALGTGVKTTGTPTIPPTQPAPITPPPTPPVTPPTTPPTATPPPVAPTSPTTATSTSTATQTPPTSNITPGAAPAGSIQVPGATTWQDQLGKLYSQGPSTATPGGSTGNANEDALAASYKAQAEAATTFANTINGITSGAIPLNAGQQAQVSYLQQQFQDLISQQQRTNLSSTNTANIRGYQTGAAEYDPMFQAKTINSIAAAGATKIASLQSQEASAVSQLTEALKTDNINNAKTAYQALTDAQTATQNGLKAVIQDIQDQITAAQAEADKQQQYNLDVAKFNQTGDQNAFDNALKTEQEKFDESYKTQTLKLDQFKAGMGAGGGAPGGITNAAQLTPSGAPDPASQKQVLDQITAKYGPMTAQAIQGLANYSINPADWSSRAGTKGLSRADAVSLAQMYDPTYSDTNYAIRASYLKSISSTQTGTVGSAVNAANKAVNHLTAYVTTMSQLKNAPVSLGNAIFNPLENILSPARSGVANQAKTEGLGVAEELAKFFKGSGTVDVASIDAWSKQLSTNASPQDVKGTTQGAITLLAGQLETLAEQYQSTMGKQPETDFLNASARASLSNLKNQGYDVPISGIYYTDKAAYLSNGGSADALTSAYKTLSAANDPNNPPTPENVLQLAQIQNP